VTTAKPPAKELLPRADCVQTAAGRLTVDLPLDGAAEPRLLLRLRPPKNAPAGEPATHHVLPLAPAPGRPGRWRAELGPEPALAEGRWDLYALPEPGDDDHRLRLLPGIRDLRALLGRAPDPAWPMPLAVRVPYATKDGYLALRAWLRPAHAEAGALRVDAAGGTLTVTARLLGATLGEGAAALLKLRGGGASGPVHEVPLTDDGAGGFTFTTAYRDLPAVPDAAGPALWDVWVRPAGKARRVRVARLLDDVADKKPVFVYPAAALDGVRVQPYYTLDNDLALRVDPA
jgi:hypothetical protein